MKKIISLILITALLLMGAKATIPSCSWSPSSVPVGAVSTVTAINLSTQDAFAITFDPFPVGTIERTTDGTYSAEYIIEGNRTAYFWRRGGGISLIPLDKELKDYKVVAICTVTVE